MTCFIAGKEPGKDKNAGEFAGLSPDPEDGLQGRRGAELVSSGYPGSAEDLLGGAPGVARLQPAEDALEVGRVNVAARAVGVRSAPSSRDPLRPRAQAVRRADRRAPGDPFKLADMATESRPRACSAPRRANEGRGRRSDLEAGLAKVFASETGGVRQGVDSGSAAATATREYPVQRLWRDAPLLLIFEGTSEIQRRSSPRSCFTQPQGLGRALTSSFSSSCISPRRRGALFLLLSFSSSTSWREAADRRCAATLREFRQALRHHRRAAPEGSPNRWIRWFKLSAT